jgi:hypothetical protein
MFEVMNRSHAVFNTCYVIVPNLSEMYFRSPDPALANLEDCKQGTGQSRMYDYRGITISQCLGIGEAYVSGILNIDGLRDFRLRSPWINFTKELRTEEYKIIYDSIMSRGGIYPKNMCMKDPPLTSLDQQEVCRYNINRCVELGIYTPPSDWQPYKIKDSVMDRINLAKDRKI